jgi:hypothetical protein
MIRPLRQRHRQVFIALGIFLPMVFAFGIVARKPAPVMPDMMATMAGETPSENPVWERTDSFAKVPVKISLLRGPVIKLSAGKDFVKPDLLVYWAASVSNPADGLPADAVLLGAFGAALSLPETALKSSGTLVLYSLADNEIVDVSKPITPADLTR